MIKKVSISIICLLLFSSIGALAQVDTDGMGEPVAITITEELVDSLLPAEDANDDGRIQIEEIDTSELGLDLTTLDLSAYGIDPDDVDPFELFITLLDENLLPLESLFDAAGFEEMEPMDPSDRGDQGSEESEPFQDGPPLEPAAVDWAGLELRDQRLFTQLSAIFEAFRENGDAIWNGGRYRFDEMPMLLVHRDAAGNQPYGYLINHPNPELLDATPVNLDAALGLPTVYRVENHPELDRIGSEIPFDFARDIADTPTFVMVFQDRDVDSLLTADYWLYSVFTIHEAFHQYQIFDAQWVIQPDATQDTTQYPLTQENISLILLEDRILMAALASNDVAFKREALQQFLAVRQARINQDDLIRRLENNQEVAEGTARYIEYRFSDITGITDETFSSPTELAAFEREFASSDLPAAHLRDILGFGRAYTSGAVLGLLLDDIDVEWHSRVERGETFVDILAETFDMSEDEAAAALAQAQMTYDFEAINALVASRLPE